MITYAETNQLATAERTLFFKKSTTMNMKEEAKIKNIFEVNQADDFSHKLGRAIAGACDKRPAGFGMPLGDLEIAIDEGATFTLKSKVKEEEAASPEEESSKKFHSKTIKKRMKENFVELKKMLTTD